MSHDVWAKGLALLANRYGGDAGVLMDDAAGRHALYTVALRALAPADDLELLALVQADPDQALAATVARERLSRVTECLTGTAELEDWLRRRQELVPDLEGVGAEPVGPRTLQEPGSDGHDQAGG
jgi:hypothetical protein